MLKAHSIARGLKAAGLTAAGLAAFLVAAGVTVSHAATRHTHGGAVAVQPGRAAFSIHPMGGRARSALFLAHAGRGGNGFVAGSGGAGFFASTGFLIAARPQHAYFVARDDGRRRHFRHGVRGYMATVGVPLVSAAYFRSYNPCAVYRERYRQTGLRQWRTLSDRCRNDTDD